jgi:hypothetical protein
VNTPPRPAGRGFGPLLLAAMLLPWLVAGSLWSSLPERVPMHFDASGRADGFVDRSALVWFALPAFATALGGLLGFLLPRWMRGMAERNSPWLNVPDAARFRQLPADARVRAVAGPGVWLQAIGIELQVLVAWLLFGMQRVATKAWDVLSPLPSFLLVGAVVLSALLLAVHGKRAVRTEVERLAR